METKTEIFTEVARLMQREYTQVLEIDKLTSELADTLSRDDRESAQLLLEMRQNEMDSASETKHQIGVILEAVDMGTRAELTRLLQRDSKAAAESFEAGKILELGEMVQKTLAHTIRIDQVVSQKLAGKDSYYAVKE